MPSLHRGVALTTKHVVYTAGELNSIRRYQPPAKINTQRYPEQQNKPTIYKGERWGGCRLFVPNANPPSLATSGPMPEHLELALHTTGHVPRGNTNPSPDRNPIIDAMA